MFILLFRIVIGFKQSKVFSQEVASLSRQYKYPKLEYGNYVQVNAVTNMTYQFLQPGISCNIPHVV